VNVLEWELPVTDRPWIEVIVLTGKLTMIENHRHTVMRRALRYGSWLLCPPGSSSAAVLNSDSEVRR
jgi:hypothetical protein